MFFRSLRLTVPKIAIMAIYYGLRQGKLDLLPVVDAFVSVKCIEGCVDYYPTGAFSCHDRIEFASRNRWCCQRYGRGRTRQLERRYSRQCRVGSMDGTVQLGKPCQLPPSIARH